MRTILLLLILISCSPIEKSKNKNIIWKVSEKFCSEHDSTPILVHSMGFGLAAIECKNGKSVSFGSGDIVAGFKIQ